MDTVFGAEYRDLFEIFYARFRQFERAEVGLTR